MKVVAKFINNRYDSKNFSIYKDTNPEQFKKLLNLICTIKEQGYETSLKLNEKYKNTIYINFLDKYDNLGQFEQRKKYELEIKDLKPNSKGYVNFKLLNSELIPEIEEEFGNLL